MEKRVPAATAPVTTATSKEYFRECSGCGIRMVVPAIYDEGDCVCPRCFEESPTVSENHRARDSASDALVSLMAMIPIEERSEAGKLASKIQEVLEKVVFDNFLVGFLNKAALEDAGRKAFLLSARRKVTLSVLFIDVNRMREMNKRWGHQTTDEVLKRIARRIKSCLRETDIAGRFGGDEMVVILSDTDKEGAGHVASRITERMRTPFWDLGGKRAEVSIGISERQGGEKFSECLDRANRAMYQAKNR